MADTNLQYYIRVKIIFIGTYLLSVAAQTIAIMLRSQLQFHLGFHQAFVAQTYNRVFCFFTTVNVWQDFTSTFGIYVTHLVIQS